MATIKETNFYDTIVHVKLVKSLLKILIEIVYRFIKFQFSYF